MCPWKQCYENDLLYVLCTQVNDNLGSAGSPIVYIAAEFAEDDFFTQDGETMKSYILGDPTQPNDGPYRNGELRPGTDYSYFIKCFPDLTPNVSADLSVLHQCVKEYGSTPCVGMG